VPGCGTGILPVKTWAGRPCHIFPARAAIVEHAAGRMAGSMTAAADTLRGLLSAEREATRLGAARSILELGPRLREAAELERRITDLETTAARRIEQLEDRLREGGW
ncbi:MAG: hypothetical protein HOP29_19065, partial [Phycisphaerales bacterium]|nr:hypothetical protein [Phycisphaerales bacterium]